MKTKMRKRVMSFALSVAMTSVALAGCGGKDEAVSGENESVGADSVSTEQSASSNEKYSEFITVDVFDSQANFQGVEVGWFAKIVKDKFNMELNIIAPNVAGGGDTLYSTRSANGNLGDLIITNADKSRLKDMVTAGLIYDMSGDIANCPNLSKYEEAIKKTSELAEQDGIWAVPSEISNQPATEPCDALEPTNAPSLRWDLYKQIGYPEMENTDDLLNVLKQMQDAAGKSDSGRDVYALSLFADWDGDFMQNTDGIMGLYGYQNMGFCMAKVDGSEVQSLIDKDGIYVKALKFLYDANQLGIVDPESTTQKFDDLQNKYVDGGVLYSLWPWLGAGKYNTTEHTEAGKGFAIATINDMQCMAYGSMPYGKPAMSIMVGSKAKDPQRMVDFIDWLYSPEGIMANGTITSTTCGPEGLTWEMKDGKPALTEFGVEAYVKKNQDLQVPEEWGGGSWVDGASALNYKPVGLIDCDESTGMCYNYQRWDDYLDAIATTLTNDWSDKNEGAKTAIERLSATDKILVIPGSSYAAPEYSTDISTIKEQCKQTIVQYSWQMVFANSEEEFQSLLTQMQETVEGLGYNDVLAVDEQNCKDKFAAEKESLEASK